MATELLPLSHAYSHTGSRALAAALPNWPRLRVLNIGDCLLKAKGCLTFIAALAVSDNMQLEVLNLQYNEMREDGALALAKVLKRFPKLKSLEVNGNQFEEDGEGAEAIREALREMDTEDVLGTMSDMEEVDSSEEEESDGEDDGVSATEEEEAALELSADELADILGKTTITGAPSAAQ